MTIVTIVLISLVIGFAAGCLLNYAVTFKTGHGRNVGVCVTGALLGGAVIPLLLSVPTIWAALIGSVIGIAVLLWLYVKVGYKPA